MDHSECVIGKVWENWLQPFEQDGDAGKLRGSHDVLFVRVVHTRKPGGGMAVAGMPGGIEVGFDTVPVRFEALARMQVQEQFTVVDSDDEGKNQRSER